MADSMTWIDPTGVSHPFDGSTLGISIPRGSRAGMFSPPRALVDQRTPLQPGTIVRYVDVQARPLVIPVLVNSGLESTLRTTIHSMTNWFNTLQGNPGIWQATGPDGSVRNLTCYYQSGLDAAETDDVRKPGAMVFALVFLAPDPFWYDVSSTVVTPALAQPAFLSSQFLPLNLGGSGLATDFSINNTGDWETWPIWQIHGPGSGIIIANLNTNKTLNLTANGGLTLAANEVLTIDSSFGVKTILKQDGSSQAGFLVPGTGPFSLATGNNDLSVQMSGTTSQSSVQVSYKRRYLSA